MRMLSSIVAVAALALAGACAETAEHHSAVSVATTMRAAQDAGAGQDAQAAAYLQLARGDIADAVMYEVGTDGRNHALDRAAVDASVALALAHDAHQRAEAAEAQRQVENLKAEMATKEAKL
jgi:hypothetical protein